MRLRGNTPGERWWHSYLREKAPGFAIARQWAGLEQEAEMLRKEIARLRSLVSRAATSSSKPVLSATRSACFAPSMAGSCRRGLRRVGSVVVVRASRSAPAIRGVTTPSLPWWSGRPRHSTPEAKAAAHAHKPTNHTLWGGPHTAAFGTLCYPLRTRRRGRAERPGRCSSRSNEMANGVGFESSRRRPRIAAAASAGSAGRSARVRRDTPDRSRGSRRPARARRSSESRLIS